jgi:HEAT repeat protein
MSVCACFHDGIWSGMPSFARGTLFPFLVYRRGEGRFAGAASSCIHFDRAPEWGNVLAPDTIMTKNRLAMLILLGTSAGGLIIFIFSSNRNDIPQESRAPARSQVSYQGHPASYWREQMRSDGSLLTAPAKPLIGAEDPASIPVMAELLHDKDETVRQHAAQSLSTIAPLAREVLPDILASSRDADRSVRMYAALSLGSIRPLGDDTIKPLVEALRDQEVCVRIGAAEGLARMGPGARSSIPALRAALQDEDQYVAVKSALALYKIDRQIDLAIPVLVEGLKDPNSSRRSEAAKALKELGPDASGAVAALIDATKDDRLVFYAVDALGAIGPKAQPAVPALLVLLKGTQDNSRWWIDDALRKIDPQTADKVGAP